MNNLKIDLGCGLNKKEGTLGIDILPSPNVDYVLDIQTEPLPFPDQSVEYVYSSHFLEHIENIGHIFTEVSRVCVDGGELEFWTPYAWSNAAFILGHKLYLNEDHYFHPCVWHPDFWEKVIKARWLLKEITYIINPGILVELYRKQISLDFALNYYKGVVAEFGVFIEVRKNYEGDILLPKRTFAVSRSSKRYPVQTNNIANLSDIEVEKALEWCSSTISGLPRFDLQSSQLESEQLQSSLQDTHVELDRLRHQLQQSQAQLQQSQALIDAMQTSKVWKLRNVWFKFKKLMKGK